MSMLPGTPWLLAHRAMLKPNQPLKVALYGQDYVLWQDSKGQISCLPNSCPHMGAMLSEGWCETQEDGSSNVVCPFHALEFDRQGCTVLPGSDKKTRSLLEPLELMVRGDFIWTYGGQEPKIPIPDILDRLASQFEFIGYTADLSVETDLLTMLLVMHDYNHQNGTHRELFRIKEVLFRKFIDRGHHSEAFFDTPTVPYTIWEKLKQPDLFILPKVIKAHLENFFPHLVIFHGDLPLGKIAQCNFFVPESATRTRTYILMFLSIDFQMSSC